MPGAYRCSTNGGQLNATSQRVTTVENGWGGVKENTHMGRVKSRVNAYRNVLKSKEGSTQHTTRMNCAKFPKVRSGSVRAAPYPLAAPSLILSLLTGVLK